MSKFFFFQVDGQYNSPSRKVKGLVETCGKLNQGFEEKENENEEEDDDYNDDEGDNDDDDFD